jgi:uncharacterized protein YybS (DUF2232 family)
VDVETANQKQNQKLILSGIALITLIGALSISLPVFGFVCFLILPLPVLYYRMRLGTQKAAMVILGAFLFLVFFSKGLSADLFFLAGMLMLGFFMGEFAQRNLPVEKTIGYACGAVFAAGAFVLIIYGNIANLGLVRLVSDYIGKNLELTLAFYETIGMPEESITLLSSAMVQIQYVLIRILPSLCAAGLLFSAWLNLLLAKAVLRESLKDGSLKERLNAWKAPDFLVWGVVGGGLMLLAPSVLLKVLGLNGMIVLTMIYFFQGIAIIAFYFEKKKVPMALRVLLYGTIALQHLFMLVIAGIGLFDVWLNFRRLGSDNNGQNPVSL